MTSFIDFIGTHAASLMEAATAIVSAASILANFTRTDKDNRAVGALSRIVHFFAANFFALKPGESKYNR